jgi:mycofactocin system creatininase family protein
VRLADQTWPEVAAVAGSSLLVVPLGSTEQHGPHLPLSTDADIATVLAAALAAARPDVVVAPTLGYGASGEHAGFAGTLSIGLDALELVLVELVRSADAFAGVVLVNGHGGNGAAVAAATARLQAEGRAVLAWSPRPTGDAHAGRTETSVLLALRPEQVRLAAAEPGDPRPLAVVLPTLRSLGVAAVARNGVLGDPTGATAEEGAAIVRAMVADLVEATTSRWPLAAGSR